MLRLFTFALVALVGLYSVTRAQNTKTSERFIIAPPENTLLTVASQPSCPLALEDAKLLLDVDTSWNFKFSYGLRNRGNKPIRSFTVYFWTSEGTGGTLTGRHPEVGALAPGETTPPTSEDSNNVVPLTPEIREKLKLGRPLKMVVILIVKEVEFADGSR